MANKKAQAQNLLVSRSLVKPLRVSIINIAKNCVVFKTARMSNLKKQMLLMKTALNAIVILQPPQIACI